jgi:aspergillopepsin I
LLAGEVIALNQSDDQEWLSPVELGNPPQQVLLDLDTGSSDL